MAALIGARVIGIDPGSLKSGTFPLANGATAWEGGACGFDTAAFGVVKQMGVSTTLQAFGKFLNGLGLNSSGGTLPVQVQMDREHPLSYWDSVAGGGAITVANLFQLVYWASDHELTTVNTGASVAGRVWSIGPQGYPGGIGIELLY